MKTNKKKTLIIALAIFIIVVSSVLISNKNNNKSNSLKIQQENNSVNKPAIVENTNITQKEEVKENSSETTKEQETTTTTVDINEAKNTSKNTVTTTKKKEEANTTNTTVTDKKENTPAKKDQEIQKEDSKTTTNTTPEESTAETPYEEIKVEVPEPTEITKLSFEKDYVIKEIYGYPPNQFTGNQVTIVVPNTTPSISLNSLKNLNKLTIYPEKFSDSTITWSSTNDSVAKIENDKLNIYRFGEVTITATAENGVSASYKLKIVGQISTQAVIFRQKDYTKLNAPYIIGFQLKYSSESQCPYKDYKYDIELKLYKNGELVKTITKQTDEESTYLTYNDEAGTYYGEYTITDNCTNYTKKGKTSEKVITIPIATENNTEAS